MSAYGNVTQLVTGEPRYAMDVNEKNMAYLTNKSGGDLSTGAVVVIDAANDSAFKTTTTQDDPAVLGVIPQKDNTSRIASSQTIANNAAGYVQFAGTIAAVNVQGNVARGHYLRCSTTAGRAEDAGTTPTKGSFAIAVTAYSGGGAGQVAAILLSKQDAGTNTHAQIDTHIANNGQYLEAQRATEHAITTSTWTDVTGMSITLTTTGGKVEVRYKTQAGDSSGVANNAQWRLLEDGSAIDSLGLATSVLLVELAAIRAPSAASHTYKIQFMSANNISSIYDNRSGYGQSVLTVVEFSH